MGGNVFRGTHTSAEILLAAGTLEKAYHHPAKRESLNLPSRPWEATLTNEWLMMNEWLGGRGEGRQEGIV